MECHSTNLELTRLPSVILACPESFLCHSSLSGIVHLRELSHYENCSRRVSHSISKIPYPNIIIRSVKIKGAAVFAGDPVGFCHCCFHCSVIFIARCVFHRVSSGSSVFIHFQMHNRARARNYTNPLLLLATTRGCICGLGLLSR